ncbi:MAG: alpha/beta hydrolase [Candidatus Izemoplasmatales bacterium]
MRKLLKILNRFILFILTLFVLVSLIFIRPNIAKAKLEEDYFLDSSNYIDVTIKDLNDEDITTTIHYQDLGDTINPVVVLLHGTFSSSHTFKIWADELIKEGYRVIMPDLPYFGLSEGFEDNITSYRRSSEVLKYILDELSINNIHIAGNSLGGAISWYFTSEYQSMVNSLTLIDSVYPIDSENSDFFLNRIKKYSFFSELTSLYTPKFLLKNILESAYGNPDNITDETITRYYELLRKPGTRQALLKNTQETESIDSYINRIETITIPTFIIWGQIDSWISVETVSLFEESMNIPEDNIYIYNELGHVPMEEDPETTIQDYLTILNSIN